MNDFASLGLAEPLLRALAEKGYSTPTPIQARAIPPLLEGRDLLGIAQTGTGKTAAFALPILQGLLNAPRRPAPGRARVLVLAPTRELAAQIGDSFRAYGARQRVSVAVVFGGVGHGPQIDAIRRGLDVLVATPGRLLDHLDAGALHLDQCEVLVLDEADHMLDLGFIVPIRKILRKLPARRQNLFFSATMPKEIAGLAGEILKNPTQVAVTPVATTAERVAQRVYAVDAKAKRDLLVELMQAEKFERAIVFTRTKRGADRVAQYLVAAGLDAAAIHGNKSQNQRERALAGFKTGATRALVATDIAARGIDVPDVSHVVNFELPEVAEAYVHRIGRTARAGAEGIAISFCDGEERALLKQIERLTRQSLPLVDRRADRAPKPATLVRAPAPAPQQPAQRQGRPPQRSGQPQNPQRRFGAGAPGRPAQPRQRFGQRRPG